MPTDYAPKSFYPYRIVSSTGERLELEMTDGMRKFHFFIQRIFPFLLIAFMVAIVFFVGKEVPVGVKLLIPLCGMVAPVVLLYKRIVVKVSVDQYGIGLNSYKGFQRVDEQFTWGEIDRLQYSIRRGKSGGAFYKLVLAEGKKIEFLRISLFHLKTATIDSFNGFLVRISGKELLNKRW
jgi:hypothetical protein